MTLQRWIMLAAVVFVALFAITTIASYTLWSSGGDPPRPQQFGTTQN